MGKKEIKISDDTQNLFPKLKSYSVDEIMAAGGPEAFADKLGKNFQSAIERLKMLPKEAFLTNEEAAIALKMLSESK